MLKAFLKSVWNELVFGSHLAALVGVFLILITAILTDKPVSILFLLIIYMTAYIIYAYDRYKGITEDKEDNPIRSKYLQGRAIKIRMFISIYFVLLILFSYYNKEKMIAIITFVLLVMGLLYTLVFKSFTRKIIAFKVWYVAGWWVSLIVFYTRFHSIRWTDSFTLIALFLFMRLFIGINFFDLKDIKSDSERKLKTLGVIFGLEKTEQILKAVNILSAIPLMIGVWFNFLPVYSIALLVAILYTMLYFEKLKKQDVSKEFLYYVMVNAESSVWLTSLLVFKELFRLWWI